ncbi:phosphodiesterase hl [Holotrichia oblita]|uniref:Phosphodiesterase hl n=1 Tax=Holotrichia oblita TaxID=644536 RepID=A0ACB9TQZ8_HOLOL|nr:phosphodiesterase hl [Holotrichia oblita]
MEEEESAWVFDSLVCFLNGPVWNAPLESFIEENSLIFEPNVRENSEYQKVFNDFKNLVDFMLGNFMDDIGITPQQFEDACAKGTQGGITLRFDQNIFEQIWAANDYEMFKRMMTQKNVELQLQALELIEQKYGVTPAVFLPDKEVAHGSQTRTPEKKKVTLEDKIMEEVLDRKFDTNTNTGNTKEPILDKNYFLEEKHTLEEKLHEAFKEARNEVQDEIAATAKDSILETAKMEDKKQKNETKPLPESSKPVPLVSEVNSEEIKKRQEYLRAQRDKLVALKKEVRKKHLLTDNIDVNKENKPLRPKSAKKAAESILDGQPAPIEKQELAIRRALVDKLKAEVIEKKE